MNYSLELNPDNAEAHYYLGVTYYKAGLYAKALSHGKDSLELASERWEVHLLVAESLAMLDRKEETLAQFDIIADKGFVNAQIYASWGLALGAFSTLAEAREKFYCSLQLEPNNHIVITKLGLNYSKDENFSQAIKLFSHALDISPNFVEAIVGMGITLYKQEDYNEAINYFVKATRLSQKMFHLYFNIANSYYHLGNYKKSADYYAKTVEYYPNHVEALVNYTKVLLELNNTKEAIRKIRAAYKIDKTSNTVNLVYSSALIKHGDYRDAIDKLDDIITRDEEFYSAKFAKVEALFCLKKYQEAIGILQSLPVKLHETKDFLYLNAINYASLAQLSSSHYNVETAMSYCEKLNELYPNDKLWRDAQEHIRETIQVRGIK